MVLPLVGTAAPIALDRGDGVGVQRGDGGRHRRILEVAALVHRGLQGDPGVVDVLGEQVGEPGASSTAAGVRRGLFPMTMLELDGGRAADVAGFRGGAGGEGQAGPTAPMLTVRVMRVTWCSPRDWAVVSGSRRLRPVIPLWTEQK